MIHKVGLILLSFAALTSAADARDRKDRGDRNEAPSNCEKQMTVQGERATTRSAAEDKAKKAWQIAAKDRHGAYYNDPQKAYTPSNLGHDNPECSEDPDRWMKRWACTWTAAPCRR